MSSLNLKLIDTDKLLSSSECVKIVRKTLNQESIRIKKVELFGDKTVFGFLGEYFRLIIELVEDETVCITVLYTILIALTKLKCR